MKWLIPLLLLCGSAVYGQTLIRGEYFFDNDPGQGNANGLAFASGATLNQTFNISIAALSPGFHTINTRVRDVNGVWSHFVSRTFYIVPPPSFFLPATTLTRVEYFFDNDPGPGNGTAIAFTPAANINLAVQVPIASLGTGFHTLAVRAQDNEGRWSLFAHRTFYIVPPVTGVVASTLVRAEYFFDSDPGHGNATALPITSGSVQNNQFALDISALTTGFHQLGIRYRDNLGRWSVFTQRTFYVMPTLAGPSTQLTRVEYFIDANPDENPNLEGTNLTIAAVAQLNENFAIDLGGVPSGDHVLYIRTKDSNGYWSKTTAIDFTILPCSPLAPPTVPDVSRCNTGTVQLTASGAAGTQVYRWFADNSTSTILFTGQTFETPSLTASRSYFVSIFDPVTLCESNRTEVEAQIIVPEVPLINISSITLCSGTSTQLTVLNAGAFDALQWLPGNQSTASISVSAAGSYTVRGTSNGCTADALPTTVAISETPAAPTIQTPDGTTLCAATSLRLEAEAPGATSLLWSSGETTATINAIAGAYYVTARNALGCTSAPSSPVVVTTQAPAKPVVSASGGSVLCEGNTLTLSAPVGFSQYLWSTGETTQSITVASEGSYSVSVGTAAGCFSESSDAFAVTLAPLPGRPAITGNTVICEGASATLTGPAGFSAYAWSNGGTSRQVTVTTATTLSLVVSDSNGCNSPESEIVQLTVVPNPAAPTITLTGSATLCNAATATLTAPEGFASYSWSNGASTASIVIGESGILTVRVRDANGCESPLSDATIIQKVNAPAKPIVQIIGDPVLCGANQSVILRAPFGYAYYQWSNGGTTQDITVSEAGNYEVIVGLDEGCLSAASDAVAVTAQPTPCAGTADPNNRPPEVDFVSAKGGIQTVVTIPLTDILSDPDENIDLSTLRILGLPTSGASVSIDADLNLVIDYSNTAFAGTDQITIQVCDLAGSCTQQEIEVEVSGDIVVYNGMSPNGDGKNEALIFEFIDLLPETANNQVSIYNRWGHVVFEIINYNNTTRVFTGVDKDGRDLPAGAYFYKVDFTSSKKPKTGFITLRR
ncbi:MAG: gliding motility-associated C-terminal domain-containing protein [Bacteroidota bacterium]